MFVANRPVPTKESNLNDAPRRDLIAEINTLVSITTRYIRFIMVS